jgi:hypothetical protein
MISFVGLAGGSFVNLQNADKIKMVETKTRKAERPLKFKKLIPIYKTETKHLMIAL